MVGIDRAAIALVILMSTGHANAQVSIDIDSELARRAAGVTYLEDLSVNDTALIWPRDFCVKDAKLYVPGWSHPSNLADRNEAISGIALKVTILPGKRLKAAYVDAAQAQNIAKGNPTAPLVLTEDELHRSIRVSINRLFEGGVFGTGNACDSLEADNFLRKMTLFSIDTLNGFTTISELMKSIEK